MARSDRAATAALGVLWLAFPLSMFPFAEQHVSSALTGMLNGATPLFAAAVASILARRMPSRTVLIGLAVGLLGAVLIALPGISEGGGSGDQARGVLLIVAALISYGVAVNLARPLQQRNGALPVIWRALGRRGPAHRAVRRARRPQRALDAARRRRAPRARRVRHRRRARADGDRRRPDGCDRRVSDRVPHPGRGAGAGRRRAARARGLAVDSRRGGVPRRRVDDQAGADRRRARGDGGSGPAGARGARTCAIR